MRALVTGDQGFVGQHLKELLYAEGMNIFGMDLRHGEDIRDYELVRSRLEIADPDYVFHLAALASPPESTHDPYRGLDTNVLGMLNLLEAMRRTGVRPKLLISGTSEEIGYDHEEITDLTPCRPAQLYGVTKLAASHYGLAYARQFGLQVVVTRAFNHAGPGMPSKYAIGAFARRIVEVERGRRRYLTHGNLSAVRNILDVRDVVRAYRFAIDQPSGSWFVVCGPEASSRPMSEFLEIMVARAKVPIGLEYDPTLGRSTDITTFPRVSHEGLTSATGWEPEIPLEQTLVDTLEWYRGLS